ncbi:MAG: hypothetical protein ABI240_08855 [Sphingomonas sp.]
MPGRRTSNDVPKFISGSTLFERMQRVADAPVFARPSASGIEFRFGEGRDLVVVDVEPMAGDGRIRFDRAEIDGQPGVVMQERGDDGEWSTIWSLPTSSTDAREGMIGWLNRQSHRWDRFARMLERRGGDELTAWIFELMVVPSTNHARPPRFEPQARHVTIDAYGRAERDCACRPASMQHGGRGGYC